MKSYADIMMIGMLQEPLKAKATDLLLEKGVLVEKHRGLQLPGHHDSYCDACDGDDDDGDNDDEDDDDGGDGSMVMMQIVMKTTLHLVIEGKRKGQMDFEDRATVPLQWHTCDLLLWSSFGGNTQWAKDGFDGASKTDGSYSSEQMMIE